MTNYDNSTIHHKSDYGKKYKLEYLIFNVCQKFHRKLVFDDTESISKDANS